MAYHAKRQAKMLSPKKVAKDTKCFICPESIPKGERTLYVSGYRQLSL